MDLLDRLKLVHARLSCLTLHIKFTSRPVYFSYVFGQETIEEPIVIAYFTMGSFYLLRQVGDHISLTRKTGEKIERQKFIF